MGNPSSVPDAIARWGLRRSGDTHVGDCPFCGRPGYKHSRPFVLFGNGRYFCHACGAKGRVGDAYIPSMPKILRPGRQDRPARLPDPRRWANHPRAVAYFGSRGLTEETVKRFALGWDRWRFTIPCWRLDDGRLMGIKRRKDPQNHADCASKYTSYKGSKAWLFNEAALAADEIVACEGEIDVMTLAQSGVPAVCSTAGVGHFPEEWIKRLEGKRIVVWFDADENGVGQREALKLARRLDAASIQSRIVVDQPAKDVNEALRADSR